MSFKGNSIGRANKTATSFRTVMTSSSASPSFASARRFRSDKIRTTSRTDVNIDAYRYQSLLESSAVVALGSSGPLMPTSASRSMEATQIPQQTTSFPWGVRERNPHSCTSRNQFIAQHTRDIEPIVRVLANVGRAGSSAYYSSTRPTPHSALDQ